MDRNNEKETLNSFNNQDSYKDWKNNDTKRNTSGNEWDELSNILGNEVSENEYKASSFLDEISNSLAKQVTLELEEENYEEPKKEKKHKGLKIFLVVFSLLAVILCSLAFTSGGRRALINIAGKYIYGKFDYDKEPNDNINNNKDLPDKSGVVTINEVVNILLIGVEEIGGASNTDSIMIATMNTKNNTMKVTSLMRDLYVTIPGYSKNRINAVYGKGGIELMYSTIKENLGIELDGYAMVNFEAFEKIIDLIGGIEITLTKSEANYLNTTNYISDPKNRNVVEGKQVMNGNQALGYTRVRKVSTGTENNDFGRTQRHRIVINAMFEKIKTKDIISIGLLMNKILSNVKIKTDITPKEFNHYLEEAITLNVNSLEMLRIPSDGTYNDIKVRMGKYNQDVLEPKDWNLTREELRKFIYGE